MKKNKKNNMKSQNKRFLIFILAFLSIFIITIPTYYIIEYNRNKVSPFVEEIKKIEDEGNTIIRIKGSEFKEFNNFKLICKDFDITKRYSAVYTAEVDTTDLQISNITMEVSLCANWIKFNEKSNGGPIKLTNTKYNPSTTVSNLQPLAKKANVLLPLPEATTYVLLSYDRGPSNNRTKYTYLLEYEYGTYDVLKGGYQAK